MLAHILGVDSAPTEALDLTPVHLLDRCVACGDCLSCFGQDGDCGGEDGRTHVWLVYPEDAGVFRQRMGLDG